MTTAPFALAGSGDADASCSPKAIKVKAELPCETYTSPSPKAHATTIIGEHFSAALKTSTGADKVQATGALDSTTTASAHANDVHDIRLQLFDLPSAWSTSPAHAAYTCQRRLLLVFQEQELQAQAKIMLEDQSSDANAKTHRVVIAAAQLYEYRPLSKEDRPRLLYLSKLDTTGLATPRHAQRHVVRALVQAVLAYAGESASMWHVPYRLHVLSTANPEYLFPRSAELSGKRVLEGRPLIYW